VSTRRRHAVAWPARLAASRYRLVLAGYAVLAAALAGLYGTDRVLTWLAGALNVVFFGYFLRHLAFALAAARWVEPDLAAPEVGADTYLPTVAVLVGCHNEALVVDGLVRSLLALDYPAGRLALVVVDDGSTDDTGTRLDAWAARAPRLRVLHRPPGAGGGKSGALNQALSTVDAEVVMVFDADHEPAPNALRRLVRHFRDPQVAAVMGRCVVRNAVESRIASAVFIDYLSGYLVNEYGRQALFELPAYGGANCAVRTSVLHALGGWNPHSVTEDTDLTIRVLLAGGRVRYDPTAVDYEEAVLSVGRFWRQRYRWARGHQACLREYWRPVLTSRRLSPMEKAETLMFLGVYHVPVLCGLGILLGALRGLGLGHPGLATLLPLSALLFAGPFTEIAVGLLVGRAERRTAWLVLGFLPTFALSILVTTRAYLDGMLGRGYTWVKTARSGATSTPAGADSGTGSDTGTAAPVVAAPAGAAA